MTDPTPASDTQVEALREAHRVNHRSSFCRSCAHFWPCPTASLLARLDAAEARAVRSGRSEVPA